MNIENKKVCQYKMKKSREEINIMFNIACENGEVYTIRTIIKENQGYIDLESNDGYGFKKACEKGYVNIIDYLIKTKEVVKNIDLDFQENIGFFIACENEKIEVLKYYLNHKEYQSKKGLINKLFIKSCESSNLEMYKILKDFDLLNKINPEWNKYQGFKSACKNELTEIMNDIIFTLKLPLKDDLKEWLKSERYERVINIFKKRDMYNLLEK